MTEAGAIPILTLHSIFISSLLAEKYIQNKS